MNLISCDSCGVVFDNSKLDYPEYIYNFDGSINGKKAEWNGNDHVPFVPCPVCGEHILRATGTTQHERDRLGDRDDR